MATLMIGALFGYVLAALGGTLLGGASLLGATGESPEARQYMLALLQRDPDLLAALRPNRDVASRALEIQNAKQGQSRPISLTYLGGKSVGRYTIAVYTVELQGQGGQNQFFPLALTLVGGKVVRIE